MSASDPQSLSRLVIPAEHKARRSRGLSLLFGGIALAAIVLATIFFSARKSSSVTPQSPTVSPPSAPVAAAPKPGDAVLTVSGYIVPRERIELSPKFMGTVKTIGVKKGDFVRKGEVIVELVNDEYRARLLEAEGRLKLAQTNLVNTEANLKRQFALARDNVESERALDEAQRAHEAAAAEVLVAKGALALAQTYLDWCTIRAPIDGTILEKLVDPNELVAPQSFGGGRGPSTAFVSMADLNDLQVEIDLNEADVGKVRLGQHCRVSPEAYPDKTYGGVVAEIAPEANRSKGTLQVKVQIEKPDRFLTPELTAKVEFLAD